MVELGPFSAARSSRRAVRVVVRIRDRLVLYDVDELKDQRPPSHDAAASRQKVAADDVLEDGRFSGGLGSHDDLSGGALAASGETRIGDFAATHNLREIERVAADGIEHQVLQLVDRGEQIFAEGGHCSGVLGAFLVFFLSRFASGAAQSGDSIRRGYQDDTAALMPPAKGYTHAQAMRRLALCFFPGYQLERSKWLLGSVWQRTKALRIRFTCKEVGLVNGLPQSRKQRHRYQVRDRRMHISV